MKVAFYLDNEKHKNIDYSNPERGNPGIGGTHFIIWSIAYYLKKKKPNLEIYLLAPIIDTLPQSINSIQCKDIYDAAKKSSKFSCDIFVFRGPHNDEKLYELIDDLKLKSVMWSHNFEDGKSIKLASKCTYLKQNVCVSREQYERLRDHDIFFKSTYIYNAIDFSLYNNTIYKNKENVICYIGSIVPSKGFHVVARNWKYIKSRVPDAKLHIIGSGKLYDKNAKLGKYKIASEKYEKKFMKYLLDENGKIDNDIKFYGVLGGIEKINVMSNAKIGITNPTGKTETFGIGAVEFQALGIPVITRKKDGHLDTVNNNTTGILINNENQFRKGIIELLTNNEKYNYFSKNASQFVNEKFNIYNICDEWIRLFDDILQDKKQIQNYNIKNKFNNLKIVREFNRRVKLIKVFNKLPSLIEYEYWCKYILKIILRRS